MIDYFALLEQPRQPWLDPVALKAKFLERTRESHPDVAAAESIGFDQVNIAYQTLADPKRRLQHLLGLEGAAPGENMTSLPGEINELFSEIGRINLRAARLQALYQETTSTLGKALLTSEAEEVRLALRGISERLEAASASDAEELHEANELWTRDSSAARPILNNLYQRFSYLTKWREQIREKLLDLGETGV